MAEGTSKPEEIQPRVVTPESSTDQTGQKQPGAITRRRFLGLTVGAGLFSGLFGGSKPAEAAPDPAARAERTYDGGQRFAAGAEQVQGSGQALAQGQEAVRDSGQRMASGVEEVYSVDPAKKAEGVQASGQEMAAREERTHDAGQNMADSAVRVHSDGGQIAHDQENIQLVDVSSPESVGSAAPVEIAAPPSGGLPQGEITEPLPMMQPIDKDVVAMANTDPAVGPLPVPDGHQTDVFPLAPAVDDGSVKA